jgi:hypothetical protein
LVRAFPTEVEYPWGRALALLSLGAVQYKSARLDQARSTFLEARRLYETLVREHPGLTQLAAEHKQAQAALDEVEQQLARPKDPGRKAP